jgi:hypothetical protein
MSPRGIHVHEKWYTLSGGWPGEDVTSLLPIERAREVVSRALAGTHDCRHRLVSTRIGVSPIDQAPAQPPTSQMH